MEKGHIHKHAKISPEKKKPLLFYSLSFFLSKYIESIFFSIHSIEYEHVSKNQNP